MATIAENFKEKIVEGRFTALSFSIVVLAMRFLLFYFHGVPESSFPDTGFLWQYLAPFFANPLVSFGAATLFIFLIALLISGLNNRFSLIRTRTTLPFIVPLFLFSLHPSFLTMTPDFISIALILIASFPLLEAYQQSDTQLFSFRSSVLIGIAGLFQIYALLMLPLWWRGEVSMRGLQSKSFFTFVFGVFLVYLSVFSVYFLFDNVPGFFAPFLFFAQFPLFEIPYVTPIGWIGIVFVIIAASLYMLLSVKLATRSKILALSSVNFIVFVISFSMIFQVIYGYETVFFFWLSVVLIGYLIAYYHSMATSKIHVYGAYLLLLLLIGFYLLNLFSF